MKRLWETILVLLTMVLWLPLLLTVALTVLVTMGRPVWFRQERAGKGGRPFRILKFRTMRSGEGSDTERLTRVGRVLRATSLDELPQLLQVLTGTMALVGPRPLPVRYLPRYTPEENRRHEVRPGITGWAQVNGRNALTWEQKFAHDVWYVDHRSFGLDVKILFLSVARVFARSGVNAGKDETMEELRPDMVKQQGIVRRAVRGSSRGSRKGK